MTVRTRFAPSPTGALHIGGARTAIFNWLFARHYGGNFILRIEDTDRSRSTEESIEEIIDAMNWLGLDWDEGPFRQSDRLAIYQDHAERLLASGHAYKCYVTPEELDKRRKEAQGKGEVFRYKREWADKNAGPGKPFAIRLQTPDEGIIEVQDLLRGTVRFDAREIDDFVILKGDGFPTYNFAVVVDDATMDITHVIRGDDHLINTPRQTLIYEALSLDIPEIAHVSMILGPDNKRLSKRHGATSVVAYKEEGYLPEAIVNYLTRLGWSHGDQEIFSRDELIEKFTLDNVGKSAAVFNPEKLEWLNSWYIRNKPAEEVAGLLVPILKEKGLDVDADEKLVMIVKELGQRAKTLHDITNSLGYFYAERVTYEEKAADKFLNPEILDILSELTEKLSSLDDFTIDNMHGVFEQVMEERNLKLGEIAQPVRVALTGGTVSPGIFEIMNIMGQDMVIKRLGKAINTISSKSMDKPSMYDKSSQERLKEMFDYELWLLGSLSNTAEILGGETDTPTVEFINRQTISRTTIGITEVLGARTAQKIINSMTPLTFTACYKIIDMIFVWILEENYLSISNTNKKHPSVWTFSEKVQQIPKLVLVYPPDMQAHVYLKDYLFALYKNVLNFRNEIIHRNNFTVSADGKLIVASEKESYKLELDSKELDALVKIVVIIAKILSGDSSYNLLKDKSLKYHLDLLQKLHQLDKFNQLKPHLVKVKLKVPMEGEIFPVDLKSLRQQLVRMHPTSDVIFDLEALGIVDDKPTYLWKIPVDFVPDIDVLVLPTDDFDKFLVSI